MNTEITRPELENQPVPSVEQADASMASTLAPSPERRLCAPPIDIYETDEGLVLCADLPGVTAEGLELQVLDNKLTLFGRVTSLAPEGATPLHQEYHVCDFLRSFILSDEVDHERITAKINNGVLKVILPKADRGEPRRIEVRTD